MKKLLFIIISLLFVATLSPQMTLAQAQPTPRYQKATVLQIEKAGEKDINGKKNPYQNLKLKFIDGPEKGKVIDLEHGGSMILSKAQLVHQGDTVVISSLTQNGKTIYSLTDRYRITPLILVTLVFFGLVFLFTGKKGIGSLAGLLISLAIIILYIVPQILQGSDPLMTSILGSLVIMVVTLYLAHGFNQRTTIALISTFLSLALTGILAIVAVSLTKLSGLGSEDAYNLFIGSPLPINIQGLLLGGIIIGALGVLDDTTTTQATTVAELADANPALNVRALFTRGMVIGKEHITSLVNTLVLAYAGAGISVFIFIYLSIQTNALPLWVLLNNEILAEEIVRTLVGSIGLILAVPITTLLAAFFARNEIKIK